MPVILAAILAAILDFSKILFLAKYAGYFWLEFKVLHAE